MKQLQNAVDDVIIRTTWQKWPLTLHEDGFREEFEQSRMRASPLLQHVDTDQAGLHVWKIKDLKAEHWPKEEYGFFYERDCYLILSVRAPDAKNRSTSWHLHIWLGKKARHGDVSAAFKVAQEMDQILDHEAILHREVEGQESKVFLNYFSPISFLLDGSDTSYWARKSAGGSASTRLFKFYKPSPDLSHHQAKEVPARLSQLNNSFVYVLDSGRGLCQWNGCLCMSEDVQKACHYMEMIKARRGCTTRTAMVNEGADEHEGGQSFYPFLSRASYMYTEGGEDSDDEGAMYPSLRRNTLSPHRTVLLRLSVNKVSSQFVKAKEGNITEKDLEKKGVNILDTGKECFFWISKQAGREIKHSALVQVHEYLSSTKHPLIPATVLKEGQRSPAMTKVLKAS